ncbi:hypothetical protein CDD83_2640 [Cordyceps sp. RAO-2017]|nr:hypothetical protein CDD83_2640 [Cordyceps sp. RAO-2017]
MRDLDRKILLSVGLPVEHLPAHLKGWQERTVATGQLKQRALAVASAEADDDDGTGSTTSGEGSDPRQTVVANSDPPGQPDNNEMALGLKHFYSDTATNGCKPLHLTQIMAAQGRTNPDCDGDPDKFGMVVLKKLKSDDKANKTTNVKTITSDAQQTPANRADIASIIYSTVHDLLMNDPYDVPGPILDSFTAMKVPEAVEYLVTTLG